MKIYGEVHLRFNFLFFYRQKADLNHYVITFTYIHHLLWEEMDICYLMLSYS